MGLTRKRFGFTLRLPQKTSALLLQNLLSVESDDLLPSIKSDPMSRLGWSGEVVCLFTRPRG